MERRMKTIGIIGGMSCESTALYYDRLNTEARRRLGGLHSAECVIWSVDFDRIERLQAEGEWAMAGAELARIAVALEGAGAELILIATNTMHKVADAVRQAIGIPLIHIAEATAATITRAGYRRPGLMATAYTMEQDFYVGALQSAGLEPVIPETDDRAETHRIIYDELCRGVTLDASRAAYEAIAARLIGRGADCLILGCTEVGMLLNADNVAAPVFDTTLIHADAALEMALAE
jgi:aspartate racemase